MKALRFAAQLLLYVPLMVLIGYFSTRPRFSVIAPDEALLRLSFTHAAAPVHPCRKRSAEELAKLPPNMRAPLDCPRERVPLQVSLELDGREIFERTVPPTGLRRDGDATVYFRTAVPAGRHRVVVRMGDQPGGGFDYTKAATIDFAPGAAWVIDFRPSEAGFVFRG